jgi:pimeloyl-ACP methyl ester carboxylesterase
MFVFLLLNSLLVSSVDPDVKRSFGEVCKAHGYQFESHNVTTSDGYILTLFRIPGKSGSPVLPSKPVAFLQHGLLDLADIWILNDPCPGFIMADAGFDVWFGNSRGSFHSLGHKSLNYKKDAAYWQFSWMHMAKYDIPAVISYVLSVTKQGKLTYIGHSQGTIQMFAQLSQNPSFMENINIFIALGPVGVVRNIDVPVLKLLKEIPLFKALEDVGIYHILPNEKENIMFYEICHLFESVCEGFIGMIADMHVKEVDNVERFPIIMSHEPGGTSTQNMEHWQQMMDYQENKAQMFNYGDKVNQAVYGQSTPPLYDFSKIPGPIAIFAGVYDRLADPKDVAWLKEVIPQSSIVYYNDSMQAGHLTFISGKDLSFYKTVISLARTYGEESRKLEL